MTSAPQARRGLDDLDAVVVAGLTVLGVWSPSMTTALIMSATGLVTLAAWSAAERRRPAAIVTVVVAAAVGFVTGAWRGDDAWDATRPDDLGAYTGWATVVTDPAPRGPAWRTVLEIDDERFELVEYGRAAGLRVSRWEFGSRVVVSGERRRAPDVEVRRLAVQHVVGRFEIEWASDTADGSAAHRITNDMRTALARASVQLGDPRDALYLGLVVGDDRRQPDDMRQRFRDSGLSHLTAVSGQNVAFVIAAAGPLLRRLPPWWRWSATCALVAWFVLLTRFEPSVLRAGVMAGLGATAFVLGRRQHPLRLVAVAVLALVLVDPLLVWSVGFWLSVGATVGVTCVGPWLTVGLQAWGPLAVPVGYTLGAQLGVAVPLLLVFGDLPVVSIVANVLAIPVAGAVMLYGLPAGLAASVAPPIAPVAMAPVEVGVAWVDSVAFVASRLEPAAPVAAVLWIGLVLLVVSTLRAATHGES